MAVLVEATSVIVRRDAINRRFAGGWDAFMEGVPKAMFCADELLARVGFMSASNADSFISQLERGGLIFLRDGEPSDIAVANQEGGLELPTNWLQFARLPFKNAKDIVALCWLYEHKGEDYGAAFIIPTAGVHLATPRGWSYENSLSRSFVRISHEKCDSWLTFLRHENGTDYFLDAVSGKEVYRKKNELDAPLLASRDTPPVLLSALPPTLPPASQIGIVVRRIVDILMIVTLLALSVWLLGIYGEIFHRHTRAFVFLWLFVPASSFWLGSAAFCRAISLDALRILRMAALWIAIALSGAMFASGERTVNAVFGPFGLRVFSGSFGGWVFEWISIATCVVSPIATWLSFSKAMRIREEMENQ